MKTTPYCGSTFYYSSLAACLLLAAIASNASAAVIEIDPGPVGSSFNVLGDVPFTELNGQALDGSTITLDFVFSDQKLLVLDATTTDLLKAQVIFLTDTNPAEFPVQTGVSGFLSDINGQNILDATTGSSGTGLNTGLPTIAFNNVADGLLFHDVHLTFTLPTQNGAITSASFKIFLDDGTPNVLRVVPEPSSLALLGLGGVLVARRRRHWKSL
ncbi:PEP-CTERM sorting domain-containing protein [Bythopirellula polymerisocia]|uniref:PEP-CTERM motif protein n=1 Tax=Bythopirellula polymerisocia TaxID=2528003 RepID=A0A5C6CDM1_9BACT|nr:PEP-CTERM sorting domain-containing protein [Bythopirellula polymerisocia]TWU21847.1 PEP-CTERM motif protein [Bythopirellula polymerisocia]